MYAFKMEQIFLLLLQHNFCQETKSLVFAAVNLCSSASAFNFNSVINQTAYFSIRNPMPLGEANQNSSQGNVRDVVTVTSFQSLHPKSASYKNRLSCYFKQFNTRNCSELPSSHLLFLSHFWTKCDAVHRYSEQFTSKNYLLTHVSSVRLDQLQVQTTENKTLSYRLQNQ